MVRRVIISLTAAFMLAACGTTTASPPTTTVAVPQGWRSYTFDKAVMISVPRSWTTPACAPSVTGLLRLLLLESPPFPKNTIGCPTAAPTATTVGLALEVPTVRPPSNGGQRKKINGLVVDVGFGSPSTIQWWIPAAHIEVNGSGPLASKVMHTLRPAT